MKIRILGICLLAIFPILSIAQDIDYPKRSITLIVPFPGGNVTDTSARVFAEALTKKLGQTVVVDNKPGAAGIIGTNAAARAKPDGYTMLYGSSGPIATYGSLYKNLPYKPEKDFVTVNGLALNPLILVVNASKPYKTLEQFISYLKENPGKAAFGSPGVGTGAHLTGELFQVITGTKMLHVPYKDSGALYSDLLAGRIDAIFDFIPVMRSNLEAGKVLALGITRDERVKSFPKVPTFKEKGYDLTLTSWSSFLMPKGTPDSIVRKMSKAIQDVSKSASVVKYQKENDQISISEMGPDKLSKFINDEIQIYRKIIKKTGVSIE